MRHIVPELQLMAISKLITKLWFSPSMFQFQQFVDRSNFWDYQLAHLVSWCQPRALLSVSIVFLSRFGILPFIGPLWHRVLLWRRWVAPFSQWHFRCAVSSTTHIWCAPCTQFPTARGTFHTLYAPWGLKWMNWSHPRRSLAHLHLARWSIDVIQMVKQLGLNCSVYPKLMSKIAQTMAGSLLYGYFKVQV